jgi:hypothetical protein
MIINLPDSPEPRRRLGGEKDRDLRMEASAIWRYMGRWSMRGG